MTQRRSDVERAAEVLAGDDLAQIERYRRIIQMRMESRPECDVLDWAIKSSAWRQPRPKVDVGIPTDYTVTR